MEDFHVISLNVEFSGVSTGEIFTYSFSAIVVVYSGCRSSFVSGMSPAKNSMSSRYSVTYSPFLYLPEYVEPITISSLFCPSRSLSASLILARLNSSLLLWNPTFPVSLPLKPADTSFLSVVVYFE